MKSEDIIKVFALYLGREFVHVHFAEEAIGTMTIATLSEMSSLGVLEDNKLILRPLSDITDEEIEKVGLEMLGYAPHLWGMGGREDTRALIETQFGDGLDEQWAVNIPTMVCLTQYLLSCGFDLPCHYLEGQTPSEAGIAILKPSQS